MPVERVLQELARLYLQNVQYGEQIAQLQQQLADLKTDLKKTEPKAE